MISHGTLNFFKVHPPRPQFCDDEDKEVVPILMFLLVQKFKQMLDAITPSAKCDIEEPRTTTNQSCSDDSNNNLCPFRISVTMVTQKSSRTMHASIDSRATSSFLSWELWDVLGQPALLPITLNVLDTSQGEISCIGSVILKMRIQEESMYTIFHVANKCEALERVTLGRTWIQSSNCQLY